MDDLSSDEKRRVEWVLNWIDRMVKKYGGTVYPKNGKRLDWGQALARECYGVDWVNLVPENPTWDDIGQAMEWERGRIPDWVNIGVNLE